MELYLKGLSDFIDHIGFPATVAILMIYAVFSMHRENREDLHNLADAMRDICECMHTLINQDRRRRVDTE